MIKEWFKELTKTPCLSYSIKDIIKWMFMDIAMRKRLIVTAGIIIVLQLIAFTPLPGIDISVLREFFSRLTAQGTQFINIIGLFASGGALSRLTIFSLGLAPFFSSCLLLQIGSAFIPKLRKYSFNGEGGRRKITKFVYIFTIIISIIYSYSIASWLESPAIKEYHLIVAYPGFGFRLMTTAVMTASVALLLFIADIINRYGIGNGFAVIAVSALFLKFLTAINMIISLTLKGIIQPHLLLVAVVIFAGLIYVVFYITRRSKAIEIKDNNQNKIVFNFKASIVGHEPVGWAASLIYCLLTIASFINSAWTQNLSTLIAKGSIVYIIGSTILMLIFTYMYALIVFDPKYLKDIVNQYGFTFVALNDKAPEDYLDNCMSKVLILTALVLMATNIIPSLAMVFMKTPYWITSLFGGTTLLLGVGVFLDIIAQAEFFKKQSESGIKDWIVCYIAFDEFEAKVKSAFLNTKGIQSLIEPLRFTWGMPVRTMVDQYRIYVPLDKKDEARGMLIIR